MTNPCFPLRRSFLLLLMLSQFSSSFYLHKSKHLALTLGIVEHIALPRLNMNLYIDIIYKINHWKMNLFANSCIFLCVDYQTLLLWDYYPCELDKYVDHIVFMFLTYYLWKVLLEWFNLFIHCFLAINYRQLFSISSFTSFDLHYYLDQVCVGCMSHQKLFVITYLLEDE